MNKESRKAGKRLRTGRSLFEFLSCFPAFLIVILLLLSSPSEAAKTRKSFHLAWDPNSGTVLFYTVYKYDALLDDYVTVGTVLYPAPPKWTIPVGTTMGTIYAVTATDNNGLESLRSADCVLVKPPK